MWTRLWPRSGVIIAGLLLVAACAPAQPTAPPRQPEPAREAIAKPAEPKPAEAKPAKPESQLEWERVLEAAQREGRVVVMGPQGADVREALTEPFRQKYGIEADLESGDARELIPRLTTERQAGQYLRDVYIQGSQISTIKPVGVTAPLEPALILPEVKDVKNWRDGALPFVDNDRHIFAMAPTQRAILFVNTNLVRADEIKSYKDLLDPKWKGNLIVDDPRIPGPGQASFSFFYMHPELGPEFIRQLATQNPVIMRDRQQEAQSIGHGNFPLSVGGGSDFFEGMEQQGLPVRIIDVTTLREGADVSSAASELSMLSNAPHPNAAKVYVNWLLSKEGQTTYVRAIKQISARVDVPTDHTYSWRVPQPGAIKTYTAEARQVIGDRVIPLLTEVFGGA